MANGDELPKGVGQRKRSLIAEVKESLTRFASVLDKDQGSDPRTSKKANANGPDVHGRTPCRRQNAIRRRRPRSVDSVVVEVCTTMLTSPQGSRIAPSTEAQLPCHKLVKDAGLTELPLSKFYRTAHHAGLVIHLLKKARPVNPFERMRHSKSDADLDLLMAECCFDEECAHH